MRETRYQHHKQIQSEYSLHNQVLENVQSEKYLDITIANNMDWGQHISKISSKPAKTLGFLAETWLLHLRVLRNLHTKLWFHLNQSMHYHFGALILKLNQMRKFREL